MRKIIFLLIVVVFSISHASAQIVRPTTFDDRLVCEENKGIWREFGNGCLDSCISKFDKYEVCTNALTYACDCGKGRCWHENQCITIKSYKKIFDKDNEEREKLLEAKRKEREERIKTDPNLRDYMQNLYVQKDAQTQAQGAAGQGVVPKGGAITASVSIQNPATLPADGITPVQAVAVPATPAVTPPPTNPDGSVEIPPAFLAQAKANQAAQAERASSNADSQAQGKWGSQQNTGNAIGSNAAPASSPNGASNSAPPLPQVPLP